MKMSHQQYASCIQACDRCAVTCFHCASACLQETDVKKNAINITWITAKTVPKHAMHVQKNAVKWQLDVTLLSA